MILKNSFTPETRELFIWKYDCDWCEKNAWNVLHHILGRVSKSPLNAATLHNESCHLGNGLLSQFEIQKRLLTKTYIYLETNGYSLTIEDKLFILKNKKYYKNII